MPDITQLKCVLHSLGFSETPCPGIAVESVESHFFKKMWITLVRYHVHIFLLRNLDLPQSLEEELRICAAKRSILPKWLRIIIPLTVVILPEHAGRSVQVSAKRDLRACFDQLGQPFLVLGLNADTGVVRNLSSECVAGSIPRDYLFNILSRRIAEIGREKGSGAILID